MTTGQQMSRIKVYFFKKATTVQVKSELTKRHKPCSPNWKAMWMGLLNQGVCKKKKQKKQKLKLTNAAWHRALVGLRTLKFGLATCSSFTA